jgi:hypothetical protein
MMPTASIFETKMHPPTRNASCRMAQIVLERVHFFLKKLISSNAAKAEKRAKMTLNGMLSRVKIQMRAKKSKLNETINLTL